MTRLFCLLLLLASWSSAVFAQSSVSTEQAARAVKAPGAGRFVYSYVPPKNPKYADLHGMVKGTNIFSRLREVSAVGGGMFMMPDLPIIATECGQVNAFYDPRKKIVVICYELMQSLIDQAEAAAKANPKLDKGDPGQFVANYLLANLRFITLHEVGHALIDILQLPVVGREEDAVDQFAAKLMMIMMNPDVPLPEGPETTLEHYRLASLWFLSGGQGDGSYNMKAFADEHSLNEQRYFNVLCYLYGNDPANLLWVVTRAGLPEERAARCPAESRQMQRSWSRLLGPHFNPGLVPPKR